MQKLVSNNETLSSQKNKKHVSFFQPKLTINTPGDAYEQEADAMADKVLRMTIPSSQSFFKPSISSVQRKCTGCQEEEKVQRKENSGNEVQASSNLDQYVSSLSSSGKSLPESSRQFFEPRFGHDFSNVRIHTDSVAAKSAQSINALAYTTGNNIVFNQGQYSPNSDSGQRLLAHELTHVVQQGNSIGPKKIQRLSWDDDETACKSKQKILVQLLFKDSGSDVWTTARKTTFRSNFKSGIESTFNANAFHIKPSVASYTSTFGSSTMNCPCSANGFKPEVEISLVPDGDISVSEDWEVDVLANSSGSFIQSSTNTSYGNLDEADNTAISKAGAAPGVTQVPAAHEFGHFLGLDHPGAGLSAGFSVGGVSVITRTLSPGADENTHIGADSSGRTVDGTRDLMGTGMGLRPFYFDSWKSHLISKHGSGCNWNIM